MNDRYRMMLRAQCTYSDHKRLMHNRRITWLRSYFSGSWARQFKEKMAVSLPDWAKKGAGVVEP